MYKNYFNKNKVQDDEVLNELKKRNEQDALFLNNFENKISCFEELDINEEEFLTMITLFEVENTNKSSCYSSFINDTNKVKQRDSFFQKIDDMSIQNYEMYNYMPLYDFYNKIIINGEKISGLTASEPNVIFYYKSKNKSCFIKNNTKIPKMTINTQIIKKFIDIINEKYYEFVSLKEENKNLKKSYVNTKNKKINELTNTTLFKIILKNNIKILIIQMFFMNLNHIIHKNKMNEYFYLYSALNDIYFSQICLFKNIKILNFLIVNQNEFITKHFNMTFDEFKNMFSSLTDLIDENNKITNINTNISLPVQESNCKKYFEKIQLKLDEKQKNVNEYVIEFNDFTRHRLTINIINTLKISETPECFELLNEYQKYDDELNDKIYYFNNIINSLKQKCPAPCFELYFSKYSSAITYGSLKNNNIIDSTIKKTTNYDLLKSNYKDSKINEFSFPPFREEKIEVSPDFKQLYREKNNEYQTNLTPPAPVKKNSSYDLRGEPDKLIKNAFDGFNLLSDLSFDNINPSDIYEVKREKTTPWVNSSVKI